MNISGKHFLVTGGAGFIGSELVHQLASQKARIVVIDNLVNGKRQNLAGLDSTQVQLVVEDIRSRERMADLMRDVDTVFHLACLGVRQPG